MKNKVIVIGAGPAGVGMGVLLKRMDIPFVILERESIGASFKKWPKEMRFITPSFTGNFFSLPDLNAITPDTSPAFSLQTEHPTGVEYADYLEKVAKHYELPIKFGSDVLSVKKESDSLQVKTNKGSFESDFVIWAAGEYQYPDLQAFEGAEHCLHNSQIRSWKELKGHSFLVIGGYESGIDAAVELSELGKQVKVIDSGNQLSVEKSDSSYSLSPYTRDKYAKYASSIEILTDLRVTRVEKDEDNYYLIHMNNDEVIRSDTQPIMATGFKSSLALVEDLFSFEDGHASLTEEDESTKSTGLFLVGPQVQHGDAIFCFIYKYRQRFGVVAEAIAKRLGRLDSAREIITEYKESNFYLKDLSCCGDECSC